MRKRFIVLPVVLLLAACSSPTSSLRTVASESVEDQLEGPRLFAGRCAFFTQVQPRSGVAGPLLFSVLPSLIGKSINALEASLRQLGQEQSFPHEASVNVEVNREVVADNRQLPASCIQFVTGRLYTRNPGKHDSNYLNLTNETNVKTVNEILGSNGLFLASRPNIFIEARIIRSTNNSGWAFELTKIIFNRATGAGSDWLASGERDLVVTFKLLDPGSEDATKEGRAAVLTLNNLIPGRVNATFENGPQTPWMPFATDDNSAPKTISMHVAETRDANSFLLYLADVLEESKEELNVALQETVIPKKREAARSQALTENLQRQTLYADKLADAYTALASCRAMDNVSKEVRIRKVTDAYKAQLSANAAAVGAGQVPPFGSPSSANDLIDLAAALNVGNPGCP